MRNDAKIGFGMLLAVKQTAVSNQCSLLAAYLQLHSSKPRPEGLPPSRGFVFCVVSVLPGYYLHQQRNEALPKKERNKMNAKVLLLGAVVATFSLSAFAGTTGAYLLKAPAASKINSPAETPGITIAYVDSASALLTPRAQGNQIKVVKGVASERNPALECRINMTGSPRAVAECSSHTTMPGCMKLASLK